MIKQSFEQIDRILAGVHHVPVMNIQPDLARYLKELRFIHPFSERLLRLGRKIHQNAALRIFRGRLDDCIEALVSIDKYRRGVVGVEAHQRAV